MIFVSVSTHGVTGTWLDEILELGVPLVLFIGLWWWSTRKQKSKLGGSAPQRSGALPPGPRNRRDRRGLRGHNSLHRGDVPDLAPGSGADRDRPRGRRGRVRSPGA